MKRILLVDDHQIVRDAIKFYFEGDAEFVIAAEAKEGKEALSLLERDQFDLMITDISMPIMNGIDLVTEIKPKFPDLKIVVLSMFDDVAYIKKMLALGVNGYVLKDTGKDDLVMALNKVLNGEKYYSQELYQVVMDSMTGSKPRKRLTLETDLSKRELEVLRLLLDEKSNQEIADELFISIRTVEGHKRSMLTKTGCKNLVGLTIYAVEHNLLDNQ